MRKHLFIPDIQVTPDTPTDHLKWIGQYIVEKKPNVIVQIGDFADMESLSSYDKGKRQYEGRRYKKDIKASKRAMKVLLKPMEDYNNKIRFQKGKLYNPEMHLTLGNHENRITRAVDDDPKMEGFMSVDDLEYESFGWTVHKFLDVVELDGVHYAHFFANPLSGRPYGGENIGIRLKNVGISFVAGHQQVYMVGVRSLSNGRRIRGIVQGACYLHDESYRLQSNNEWRGIFMLHEVSGGDYNLMEISLQYLCQRYEKMDLWDFMEKKYPELFKNCIWAKHQKRVAEMQFVA